MSLTRYTEIIEVGNLPSDLDTTKLRRHLWNAERKMRELLTDDLYEIIEAEASAYYSSEQYGLGTYIDSQERAVRCALAEAYFTLGFAIPVLGLKPSKVGGIMASTGFAENKQTLVDFDSLQKIADYFNSKAMEILAEYIPEPDTDADTQADDILNLSGLSFIAIGDPTESVLEIMP